MEHSQDCPVCFEQILENTSIIKICGQHTICLNCFVKFQNSSKCPVCRFEFEGLRNALPQQTSFAFVQQIGQHLNIVVNNQQTIDELPIIVQRLGLCNISNEILFNHCQKYLSNFMTMRLSEIRVIHGANCRNWFVQTRYMPQSQSYLIMVCHRANIHLGALIQEIDESEQQAMVNLIL